ncbi:GNAT family N-acetyltransferase [Streptomyces sp. CAU 1734]|uniref:GNAT family N-acetyltransferase n=1 Tax=Streptomyces sp. CAU 1734 TaxID=3140360 RepID=UPI003261C667
MQQARRAAPSDAEELIRLREVMIDSLPPRQLGEDPPGTDWRANGVADLRSRLADPGADIAAFVIDRPGGSPAGLAACAVGTIAHRLAGPGNPHGLFGYVFSVATDPDARRRGHSRACLEALVEWFRTQGVSRIDLHASPEGEPLYAALGFTRTPDPAMRLTLPAAR